jgi:carbon monoxide dehydrogenase subunit G
MAKNFTVSRAIEIAAPPERILPLLTDFREWRTWSPWEKTDANLEREYTGPTSGVGAVYSWKGGGQAGAGRMEVLEVDGSHVAIDQRFRAPVQAHNRIDFQLTPAGDRTRVEWTMTGPQNVAMLLMSVFWKMDKMVGPDFEKGLATLKTVAESR